MIKRAKPRAVKSSQIIIFIPILGQGKEEQSEIVTTFAVALTSMIIRRGKRKKVVKLKPKELKKSVNSKESRVFDLLAFILALKKRNVKLNRETLET